MGLQMLGTSPAAVEAASKSDVRQLVVVGDSLAAGNQDRVGDNWPQLLSTALGAGVAVVNHGNPAWTSTELAVFQGAVDLTLDAFTIPAAVTPVTFTVSAPTGDWSPPGGNGTYAWLGAINGIAGIVKRTTGGGGTWTFTRLVAGSSTPVAAGSTFHCTIADTVRGGTAIILAGRNNTASLATVQADIAAVIARLSPTVKRYIVVSVLTASNETSGSNGYNLVVALNTALKNTYGARFVDARRYMIDSGLAYNGLAAAGADTTAITGDTIPPQLMMADLIHPNRYGTRALAQAVLAKMFELGWAADGSTLTVPAAVTVPANLSYSPGYEASSFAVGGSVPNYASVFRSPDARRDMAGGSGSLFGLRSQFFATSVTGASWNLIIPGTMTVAKSQSLWVRPSVATTIKARVEGYTAASAFVVGDYGQSFIACPANVWTKVASPSAITGASVAELRVFIECNTVHNAGDIIDFDDYSIISGTTAP